ncbi:hypothetical protein B0H11DRAFT_1930749 [Mycena galericulata]|nr:hypothetical protein B0H11DRAFT_1930749 [Mycena galericulata]
MSRKSMVNSGHAEGDFGDNPTSSSESTRAAHREACAKYSAANALELRIKARARMRGYRKLMKEKETIQEEARRLARASSKAYRESNPRHADVLAMRQRLRRREAFEKKYGREALIACDRQEQDAVDAKWRAQQEAKWAKQEAAAAARLAQWAKGN